MNRLGLILSGGGARGAYQAGVTLAIAEIATQLGHEHPFQVYSGVSAGGINAAILASHQGSFYQGSERLRALWSSVTTESVYHADLLGQKTGALFSTNPLRNLIKDSCQFENIQENINLKQLHGVSLTALEYGTLSSRTFIQGSNDIMPWERPMHRSEKCRLTEEHVMASTAIPLLFPPVRIGSQFYGDGCIRNQSPCAPAIYMGAERLIAIGVRRRSEMWFNYYNFDSPVTSPPHPPSLVRVANVLFHSMMMDGLELDIQRITATNAHVAALTKKERKRVPIREVPFLWISPSVDISKLAAQKIAELPRMIRYFLKDSTTLAESHELISYLFFEPNFCKQLLEIGYEDGRREHEQIQKLIEE